MDWFTFVAQIINFLVLVALLRWLLYDRIVDAMRQREQKIAGRLEEAEQQWQEADRARREYEDQSREVDQHREDLLMEARQEAKDELNRLREEARREADQQRQRWREEFERQRERVLADVRQQIAEAAVQATRRTVAELADQELETRLCQVFARQLDQLDDGQRAEIANHLGNGDASVTVRSSTELTEQSRAMLRDALQRTWQQAAQVDYEIQPDLICGLDVEVGGYTLGWNIREFLGELAAELDQRLEADVKP